MQIEEYSRKRVEQGEGTFYFHYVFNQLTLVLGISAVYLVPMLLYFFINRPLQTASTIQLLSFFIGGIVLLNIIMVLIATFIRRKNRDVILLKVRLAEIYLSALRRSSLNPQVESPSSND